MQGKNKTTHIRLRACLRTVGLGVVCLLLCVSLLSASEFSPAATSLILSSHSKASSTPTISEASPGPVQAVELPESVDLPVEVILQAPQLPNGCEATSLAMVLRYHGYGVDKMDIAYSYIPREDFEWTENNVWGPHPEAAYAGDPGDLGFYCFAPPVVAGANAYLDEQGSSLSAVDISGAGLDIFQAYLAQGYPVLIWTTLDCSEPTFSTFAWALPPDGEIYVPYSNLHCEVLYGYDTEFFYLCDPLQGRETISIQQALSSYEALGSHAVVIL